MQSPFRKGAVVILWWRNTRTQRGGGKGLKKELGFWKDWFFQEGLRRQQPRKKAAVRSGWGVGVKKSKVGTGTKGNLTFLPRGLGGTEKENLNEKSSMPPEKKGHDEPRLTQTHEPARPSCRGSRGKKNPPHPQLTGGGNQLRALRGAIGDKGMFLGWQGEDSRRDDGKVKMFCLRVAHFGGF